MSKIDLGLDFQAIMARINKEKDKCERGEWRKKINVSSKIITNVHGKVEQKPSIEYIIAVARGTGRPIEYYLWGDEENQNEIRLSMGGKSLDKNKNISDLLESARRVLNSGHPMAVEALERNIKYFAHAIEIEDRLSVAETSIKEMRKEFDNLKNEWVMKRASVGGATKRKAM